MSGDVQPRKRKDKKRKKDDSSDQLPTQPQTPPVPTPNDDLNIHVHKEDGTGGGICAKIVFFFLFSALAVLIGLIITEHRGLTDLDTVDTESRFSQIFEGWIDNSPGHEHEDDHLVDSLEDDDHDDDEHEESHEVEDDDHEEEEEEDEEASEEQSTPDDDDEDDEEEEQDDDDDDEEEDQIVESEEENDESAQRDEEDEDEEEVASEEKLEDDDDDDIDESENINEDDDDDDEPVDSKEQDVSEEQDASEEQQQEASEENEETEASKEDDNEPEDGDAEEVVEESDDKPEEDETKENNRTPEAAEAQHDETLPDLSRRATIVVPPTYQEVQQDIEENIEEEYSDEDGEIESDDDRLELKSAKLKYQELRTTYSRSLTPESEPEYQNKPAEEDEEEYDEEVEEEEEEEEDVDEEEGDEEDESDEKEPEDDDLLVRLDAKYGKLHGSDKRGDLDKQFSSWKRINVRPDNEAEESDSDRQSDDPETYDYENITNKDDWKIKEKLDEAQKTTKNNPAHAITLFDVLLKNYPSSPRSFYGKAQALDALAERKMSNELLQQAITTYLQVLSLNQVPDVLFQAAADRCVNRMRFVGNYDRTVDVHAMLINRFPDEPKHRNQLAVSYLTINRVNKAKSVLKATLSKYPNDGFALVHYGFILKTFDNNLEESVVYLKKGIATREPGVLDGRFYFHLGDALARLGQTEEATKVYEEGVEHKLFFSKYQRSLYNVDRLKGRPWWKKEETPYKQLYSALENNWRKIRDEGLSLLGKSGHFQSESENLRDTGDWKQFELFSRGRKNVENCKKSPITCEIIDSIPDARGCRRGQTKFSVMHPGTHVWPHCGPTNCRLRVHLGLNVPPNTFIRVADQVRSWENGKVLIFDDSFEHEVWHNGSSFRLILIVDVWHPELTAAEKRKLSPI